MKTILRLLPILLVSIVLSFTLQSCDAVSSADTSSSDSDTTTSESTEETTTTTTKGDGKMTAEDLSNHAAKHAEDISAVYAKVEEINNEKVARKDHFDFLCSNDSNTVITFERIYNEKKEIHHLFYTKKKNNDYYNTQYYFLNNKLFFQFHHHEVNKGGKQVVDDHRTYYKDGEMFRCLEREYSYEEGKEDITTIETKTPYHQVNCVPADKLPKDIETLLTMSKEEVEKYFCK